MNPFSVARGAVFTASVLSSIVGARIPTLHFQIFARTGLRLTDVVWTGRQFLYVENTTNRVFAAGPSGMPVRPFARMPREVEETRCVVSPGGHGFPRGEIYCNSPTNTFYRISANGKKVGVFAKLPHSPRSDGALAFDTVGRFGYNLIAATGRSGNASARGGMVYRIDPSGVVRRVGSYVNPGGADQIAVAPAHFGSATGAVLLAVDAGKLGSLVAMDAQGHARTLARLPDGLNPVTVVASGHAPVAGAATPGLYVTDTISHIVYFVPQADFRSEAGEVVIGGESHGFFWGVRPSGRGFAIRRLTTTLTGTHYNLEGATYIAG